MRTGIWKLVAMGVLACGVSNCSESAGENPSAGAGSTLDPTTAINPAGSATTPGPTSSAGIAGDTSAPATSGTGSQPGGPNTTTALPSPETTEATSGPTPVDDSTGSEFSDDGQSSASTAGPTTTTGATTMPGSLEPELVTSAEDAYWKLGAITPLTNGTADVTVDPTATGQRWDGFGGTFNEMGWDALSMLTATEVAEALKLLYDPKDGAGFTYGRIPLGASDYSSSWYTLDDVPSGVANDYQMEYFSIARDREKLIPFIKEAMKVQPDIQFWASPWVVPAWMLDGSSNMKGDAQTLGAHALYMARFVEEYAKEGIQIRAVHPQNEPGYGRVHWKQEDLIAFMKTYLGPTLAERVPGTEVWCGTMSKADGGGYDMALALATASDAEAMNYVKGFGLQWNLHDAVESLAATNVPVMQTEHRCGNYNFTAPYWDRNRYSSAAAQNDHLYGEESWQGIRDWIVAGVNSYVAWNMVLDTAGKSLDGWPQNALLVVDETAKKLIVTPAYYTFKHFSHYITPGATLLGTTAGNDAYQGAGTAKYGPGEVAYDLVNAFAFKNPDGSIIVQLYNKDVAAKSTTVDTGAGLYQFDVPAHGWATLRVPQ